MRMTLYACNGCTVVATRAKDLNRFRSDLWCDFCIGLARTNQPTPKEIAKANGEDSRGGLTRMLDAWSAKNFPQPNPNTGVVNGD